MKCHFIGGVLDGQDLEVGDEPPHQVQASANPDPQETLTAEFSPIIPRIDTYYKAEGHRIYMLGVAYHED
jgi:hypothetical protein